MIELGTEAQGDDFGYPHATIYETADPAGFVVEVHEIIHEGGDTSWEAWVLLAGIRIWKWPKDHCWPDAATAAEFAMADFAEDLRGALSVAHSHGVRK